MSPVRIHVSRESSPVRYVVLDQRPRKDKLVKKLGSNENTLVSVRLDITQHGKHSRVNSLGDLEVKHDSLSNSTGRTSQRASTVRTSRPLSLERKKPDLFKQKSQELHANDEAVVSLVEETDSNAEDERELKRRQNLKTLIERTFIKHGAIPTTTPEFYRYGKLLGKGAFGKVILAVHALSGRKVAIKYIEKSYMKEERRRRKVFQEILAMRTITHPNVVKLYEVFESNSHLLMVLEYARGGDLLHFVKDRGRLCEDETRVLFRQIVEAVRACHIRNIIHRDVKLDNILLDRNCLKATLCDFGVCRSLKRGEMIREHCGTPAYLAPEIVANVEYDGFYVDFWSLGVTLYAMVTGSLPFKAKTLPDLQKTILKGKYELPEYLSDGVCDVIDGLLQLVPQKRFTFEELFQHPWVNLYAYVIPPSPVLKKDEQEGCLRLMKKMGFYPNSVLQSLRMREMNHATATFFLILQSS